jgi:hypothetical protein
MRRRKRNEFDQKPTKFLTFYYPRKVLPAVERPGKRIIMVRTKAEWARLGKFPKPGEVGFRVPLFSYAYLSQEPRPRITQEYFDERQVMDGPVLEDRYAQNKRFDYMAWRYIVHAPVYGPARNKLQRALDKYWFVPVPPDKFGLLEDDLGNISPKRRIIYPAAIYRDSRESRAAHGKGERDCQWCEKPFTSLRRDAQFCSGKCRKAANRGAKKHVTDVRTNSNIEGETTKL